MSTAQKIQEIVKKFDINFVFAQRILSNSQSRDFLKYAEEVINLRPKPFVKWVGGKRQLLKQFRELGYYPPKKFNINKATYHEPFVGGGAVFFDLLPERAFLADMNYELVATYRVIRDDVESLIKSLKRKKYSKELFLRVRSQKIEKLTDLQIATRFIYLNRTCFNGMYRVNSRGEFNVPFGKYTNPLICDEDNFKKVSKALQGIEINHEDYKAVLKRTKKGDFVYLDPPYHPVSKTASFTSYTANGFGEKEQLELRDVFLKLHKKGCYVMLSNSDAEFINKIYSEIKKEGVKINKVQAGRAINSKGSARGKVLEVLVTNY